MMFIFLDPIVDIFILQYRRCVIFYDIFCFFFYSFLVYVRLTYRCFFPKRKNAIHGEVVLITGAGSGLGQQLAVQMGELGASIICLDIDEKKNLETCELVRLFGGVAFPYTCDVSDRLQVERLAARIRGEIGDVNILINNVGYKRVLPFIQLTARQIQKHIDINLMSQMWMMRAFLPRMILMDRGTVIALSAVAGYGGCPNMVAFTAAKHAVRGFMEALYMELRQENPSHRVKLMTVAPFVLDTGSIQGPQIRLPGLKNVVGAEEAAAEIIDKMQRDETVLVIPAIYYYIQSIIRLFPLKVQLMITDFVDSGLEVHYNSGKSLTPIDIATTLGAMRTFPIKPPPGHRSRFVDPNKIPEIAAL